VELSTPFVQRTLHLRVWCELNVEFTTDLGSKKARVWLAGRTKCESFAMPSLLKPHQRHPPLLLCPASQALASHRCLLQL